MGDLIRFPQERRTAAVEDYRAESAMVLILPVVRIERCSVYEDPLAIMGGTGSERVRRAFAELEAAVEGDNFP